MWLLFIIQSKLCLQCTDIQNTGTALNDLFKLWPSANLFFHARVHKVTTYNTSTNNKAKYIQYKYNLQYKAYIQHTIQITYNIIHTTDNTSTYIEHGDDNYTTTT